MDLVIRGSVDMLDMAYYPYVYVIWGYSKFSRPVLSVSNDASVIQIEMVLIKIQPQRHNEN